MLVSLHVVSGGNAITIQFPHISLNGFFNTFPTLYSPKHIAIPSQSVSVGTIYSLNTDDIVPHGNPSKYPSLVPLNGNPKIPGAGINPAGLGRLPGTVRIGIHFPRVVFNALNAGYSGLGNFGTHQNTW